jgi:hypothetical protein
MYMASTCIYVHFQPWFCILLAFVYRIFRVFSLSWESPPRIYQVKQYGDLSMTKSQTLWLMTMIGVTGERHEHPWHRQDSNLCSLKTKIQIPYYNDHAYQRQLFYAFTNMYYSSLLRQF